jgi:hypothetical protein
MMSGGRSIKKKIAATSNLNMISGERSIKKNSARVAFSERVVRIP